MKQNHHNELICKAYKSYLFLLVSNLKWAIIQTPLALKQLLSITYPESPRMMTLSNTFFLDVIVPQPRRQQTLLEEKRSKH